MKVLLVLTAAVVILLATADGRACGCPNLPTDLSDEEFKVRITKEYKIASAIFTGEVMAEEYRPADEGGTVGREVLVIRLAAESWWKGGRADEVIIYTRTYRYHDGTGSGSNCDYNFVKGQKYLVYAYAQEGKLSTHVCSRTRLKEHAERDVKALDEIKRDENGR